MESKQDINELRLDVIEWKKQAKIAKDAKKKEMELRKSIFNRVFPDAQEGTNNAEVANLQIKGVQKLNYTVDKALIPNIRAALTKLKVDPDTVFQMKYDLIKKGFLGLVGQAADITSEAVTIKVGSPTLTIEEVAD